MDEINRFEKARIIGLRAKQIADGTKPIINPYTLGLTKSLHIAEAEYDQKENPLFLICPFPDGSEKIIHITKE